MAIHRTSGKINFKTRDSLRIITSVFLIKNCINSYSFIVMQSLKMKWIYANKLSFQWTQISGESQLEKQSSEE